MNSEPKSEEDIVDAIKDKFFSSMVWKGKPGDLYDFDDVQTLVMGNINGFSGLVKEALHSYLLQESRELVEALKYILETSKALDKDSLEPDKVLCHAQQIRFRSLSSLATFQQKHGGV